MIQGDCPLESPARLPPPPERGAHGTSATATAVQSGLPAARSACVGHAATRPRVRPKRRSRPILRHRRPPIKRQADRAALLEASDQPPPPAPKPVVR